MAGFGNKIAHSMDRDVGTSIFYTLGNCITIWVNVHTKTHRLGIFTTNAPEIALLVTEKSINYEGLLPRTQFFHIKFECTTFFLKIAKIEC